MEFARQLGGPDGIVPSEVSFTLVGTLFNEGRAPMAISGPWFVGQLDQRAKWAVAPLPVVSATGKPAAPFLGAEGVLMSSRSKDKRAAFAVMAFLAGDASAIARAQKAHQVVPNRAAYESREVSIDPVLEQFRAQAAVAVPMPSVPAMRMVWTPYDTALQKVVSQGQSALSALADAQREIEGYMQGAGHGR
jgi:maltose-binding protein MalE